MTDNEKQIVLRSWGSISAIGCTTPDVTRHYARGEKYIRQFETSSGIVPVAALSELSESRLQNFCQQYPDCKHFDRSVQLAAFTSSRALERSGWSLDEPLGIFLGSSRGATGLLERYHEIFLQSQDIRIPSRTSPTTTAGSVASTIARLFGLQGIHTSHSITCSTALHAFLNGIAWLRSGMINRVLVGGAEAPLTRFTIAQMQALGIYTRDTSDWPCRPLSKDAPQNTFMLGEGAACYCLEMVDPEHLRPGDIIISGYGFATEQSTSFTGISTEGMVFQSTMRKACQSLGAPVQGLIAHAPGTIKGDAAELAAIEAVFPELPAIFSNKMFVGHCFGASGALSIELALLLLGGLQPASLPFPSHSSYGKEQHSMRSVLVNSIGFGGNAVSITFSRVL